MGALTEYLQDGFAEFCPPDWTCRREVQVLDSPLAELFGYAPKADVCLERNDGQRRLWIEFEVSRADPVANQAKFATAHLFQPQRPTETFVSMVSWPCSIATRSSLLPRSSARTTPFRVARRVLCPFPPRA